MSLDLLRLRLSQSVQALSAAHDLAVDVGPEFEESCGRLMMDSAALLAKLYDPGFCDP